MKQLHICAVVVDDWYLTKRSIFKFNTVWFKHLPYHRSVFTSVAIYQQLSPVDDGTFCVLFSHRTSNDFLQVGIYWSIAKLQLTITINKRNRLFFILATNDKVRGSRSHFLFDRNKIPQYRKSFNSPTDGIAVLWTNHSCVT